MVDGSEPLPAFLKKVFWDTDVERLEEKRNAYQIIERILEFGETDAVLWMRQHYQPEEIRPVIENSRILSLRSANFWADVYDVPKEKVRCLQKFFLETHRRHWPY